MKENNLLALTDVHKEYARSGGSRVTKVLSGVSLSVNAGETVSISGPSGSGKSTLLNIMGALDRPTSGNVVFKGQEISELDDDKLSFFRNREIGFVFQAHHLLPQCTVIENVLVPSLPFPVFDRDKYSRRALELLEYVGLGRRADHMPSELSGGEQLRTAVVRALMNDPKILLADEPTGSLDNRTAESVSELFVKLNREKGTALVVVTHSPRLADLMEKRYELNSGKLDRVK